ncbi:hypothetical protein GQ457_10G028370 [Hibiscus cannabinus]
MVGTCMLIGDGILAYSCLIIWRTPPLLIAMYFVAFFTMEGVYTSAVLTEIPDGGWIPIAISFILAFIMFGWYHTVRTNSQD